MKLCETCKSKNCNKNIMIIEQKDIKTIKCLDYEKDDSKIEGYKVPLVRLAKQQKTVQGYVGIWE